MWADRFLKITLQLKFQNNVVLARVLAESLKIRVNTKYCSSPVELISEFPLPEICGTYRINNICSLLRATTHSFDVTDCYLTKILGDFSQLF
jgi:hypothetical protein